MLDEESGVPKGTRTYVEADNPRKDAGRGLRLPLVGGGFNAGVGLTTVEPPTAPRYFRFRSSTRESSLRSRYLFTASRSPSVHVPESASFFSLLDESWSTCSQSPRAFRTPSSSLRGSLPAFGRLTDVVVETY